MKLVSKFMVYRALYDKIHLSLGLRSPLRYFHLVYTKNISLKSKLLLGFESVSVLRQRSFILCDTWYSLDYLLPLPPTDFSKAAVLLWTSVA